MDVMPNLIFAPSSKNKDHMSYNRIKDHNRITLDGSTLADNLITIHQADYLSSKLIPAKSVDKVQAYEYLAAIGYSTRH